MTDRTPGPPTGVELTALPAACGDCLVVEYRTDAGTHRLLVDGGLNSKYDEGLGAHLAARSDQPPAFDVVVVTHVDRDHIDGVIRALDGGHLSYDDIWFNGRDEIEALVRPRTRGVRQGDALSALIPNDRRNRVVDGAALHVDDGPATYELPGGARCTLLGPPVRRLERLLDKWPEPTRGGGDPTEELLDAMEDPVTRGPGEFGRDSSAANGSSIAFLLEVGEISLLLTGDAFASDLEATIGQLLADRGLERLEVDLFKLSHHGSRQNMSDELLALVAPRAVLVCTDGSRFRHPDEDALEKLRAHYPDVPIHFTDDTELIRERAAAVDSAPPSELPLRLEFGAAQGSGADTPPPPLTRSARRGRGSAG